MANETQNLQLLANAVTEQHHHITVNTLLGVSFKIAVNEQEFPWHQHPNSDELFIMFEGELIIEFDESDSVTLRKNDTLLIPAGRIHRTRPVGRAVNLLIEKKDIETVFTGNTN